MVRITEIPTKKISRKRAATTVSVVKADVPDVAYVFENCVGCKWTIHVLNQIRRGVRRPGELARSAEGLTSKVLNERLSKLVRFGVLEKTSYAEIPPRVEYSLTDFGNRVAAILDQVEKLQRELKRGA